MKRRGGVLFFHTSKSWELLKPSLVRVRSCSDWLEAERGKFVFMIYKFKEDGSDMWQYFFQFPVRLSVHMGLKYEQACPFKARVCTVASAALQKYKHKLKIDILTTTFLRRRTVVHGWFQSLTQRSSDHFDFNVNLCLLCMFFNNPFGSICFALFWRRFKKNHRPIFCSRRERDQHLLIDRHSFPEWRSSNKIRGLIHRHTLKFHDFKIFLTTSRRHRGDRHLCSIWGRKRFAIRKHSCRLTVTCGTFM